MISYELYSQIRLLHQERGLNFAQIARELDLDEETVAKWARAKNYTPAANTLRKSKLEPYKIIIQRWLERHSYTATQIFQRLRAEEGYTGGFTILSDYVRSIRRVRAPAFLTLAFAPGECAQVDWGTAGSMRVGSTTRLNLPIEGRAFVYADREAGRIITILGYPTAKIAQLG
jgi:transposase